MLRGRDGLLPVPTPLPGSPGQATPRASLRSAQALVRIFTAQKSPRPARSPPRRSLFIAVTRLFVLNVLLGTRDLVLTVFVVSAGSFCLPP